MWIDVKKIVMPLTLSEYDAAYGDAVIQVWVNPPRALLQKRMDLLAGYARAIQAGESVVEKDDLMELTAEVWSAGADAETHWTAAEIETLSAHEPTLYQWAVRETWRMVDAWRADKKK